MKLSVRGVTLGLSSGLLAVVSASCDAPAGPAVQIGTVDHDLARGSTGPEVAALNEYLKTYGYFPNSELQRQYPAWRPVVASAPSDSNVFDAKVEQAVTALQKNMGLKQTGVFDAGTRAVVALPRCGVPDGIEPLDPTDKWAANGLTHGPIVWVPWWLSNNDGDLTTTAVTNDILFMTGAWAQYSAYTFSKQQPQELTFSFLSLGAGIHSITSGAIPNGSTIQLNSDDNWTDNGSPNSSQMDLRSVLLHAIGHALGLAHSAYSSAVMYPSLGYGQVKSTLTVDDVEGIRAVNSQWLSPGAPPSGAGVVRAVSSRDTVWALSGATGGNYKIWSNNPGWFQLPGAAVRIAVNPTTSGNRPWVLNDQGSIFRWNPSIRNWDWIPGCATDIGVGSDDSVWVIGCAAVDGGYQIFKYGGDAACGAGNCWPISDGAATQISVGPASPSSATPVPWVLNSYGQLFTRGSADPTVSGTWQPLPGLPGGAVPLGIAAAAGYAFTYVNGQVFSYNYQPGDVSGATAENQWLFATGLLTPAAIAPRSSSPIVVDTTGKIWSMQ